MKLWKLEDELLLTVNRRLRLLHNINFKVQVLVLIDSEYYHDEDQAIEFLTPSVLLAWQLERHIS